jgi:hypothetical protein
MFWIKSYWLRIECFSKSLIQKTLRLGDTYDKSCRVTFKKCGKWAGKGIPELGIHVGQF